MNEQEIITVTIDKAGRVVIPKPLRDELGLEPGDTLELKPEGQRIMLRRLRTGSSLRREQGVWVYRSGRRLSGADTDKVLRDLREERDRGFEGRGE